MKVTQESTAKNYLDKLAEGQRDLVVAKEQELKNIDKVYEAKKSNERLVGEMELLDIQDRNQAQIAEKLQQKEERLGAIKTNFVENQTKLEKEKANLITAHQEKISDLNTVYDYKYQDSFDEANLKAQKINTDTSVLIKDLQLKSDATIEGIDFESKLRADAKTRENTQGLKQQEVNHGIQQKTAKSNYERKMAMAVSEHENKLSDQNHRLLVERKEREKFHNLEMLNKETHHKELLKQEDQSFKQKYDTIVKTHQDILDRVTNRFNNQVNSIVKDQMLYKSNITDKAKDDFYKVSSLNPTVKEGLKDYEVSIQVPVHEKENIRLTAQGRDVTLALTRKFTDEVKEENGEINRSRRSEVFTKKFKTSEILNSKDISQSYNEGVLTFKIAKL
ncbi:Hsp20/alpha crystallin family protein [Halobacteriovorax sp. HLS]|uniref:Hsp20/alpha crystallin family protein n=1 Tax=Halobacteriovorax sp. HLS TaxID=2234000 RepID=UPI000FD779B9|nr:Hsp20/alpha crystallin family protein [Halobacteriovorax sp. HLS]